MIDRKNTTGQSGHSHPLALAFTMIAVGAVLLTGTMTLRTEAVATPGVSEERAVMGNAPAAYFPAQYVNQATEVVPMPPTF